MDSDSESKLISLISQLLSRNDTKERWATVLNDDNVTLVGKLIHVLMSMDLDSQPKPESELMSLTTQTISLFHSMDLDSQPKPLRELISRFTQWVNPTDSESDFELGSDFVSLVDETLDLEPEPELISLIRHGVSLVIPMVSKWKKLVSLCPQVQVIREQGKHLVDERGLWTSNNKWDCFPGKWLKFSLTGEGYTHFRCRGCNGKNHEEYRKAPLEVKHLLHSKHSLHLVTLEWWRCGSRECYCCGDYLRNIFYYCSACNCAMNIACVEKPPVLSIDHPKWHAHTLALFPRKVSITCDVCALADSSCPFYICSPCDFVVHQSCLGLPRVIRISRHPHRISFTPSFDKGDWSCGVCRRTINNDYGGYSCIKDGCSYAAHSRCATQDNVWDGIELEGVPEEVEEEEELEPFVRIGDGIIQHFSHQQHYLRLDENTYGDYDDKKLCQACITPIYFGNFYSCMECDFILHQACANFSRKIYTPVHPHLLTLVDAYDGVIDYKENCSACFWICRTGFFYKCDKERCRFQIHVQCAAISEPLVHESHMHPLFLTSKPGEWRPCCVCKGSGKPSFMTQTFNCIECESDFALCFQCATLPQKVRYKYDKHSLTLFFGNETSTMTYWCEICEGKVDPKERFYMCDDYCCVTIHIECLFGFDLYMKPGSSWTFCGIMVSVLPNNHHMSRPICFKCKKHCPYRIAFQSSGSVFCSVYCLFGMRYP